MGESTDILSPEGTLLTDPAQIERALAEMWRQAGAAASGEADQPAASRVCVANLIVVGAAERWGELLDVLGELSPMYPTRTVALLLTQPAGPGPESVHASVSALCHIPQPGRPQVCSEQIVLRANRARSADLHRTMLPLLESDVPVMTWWALDPQGCGELMGSLAKSSRRFIMDAGLEGVRRLTSLDFASVRDLGWYRIHRWRDLVAGMFDECGAEPLQRVEAVRVEVGEPAAEGLDAAVWLIAFLGGQLGWEVQKARCEVRSERAGPGQPMACFEWSAGGRPVKVSVVSAAGEGLVGLTLRGDGNTFEAHRGRDELRIIVHTQHVCQDPRVVHVPRCRRSTALAAALAGRAVDAAFSRAAPHAAWMADRLRQSSISLKT